MRLGSGYALGILRSSGFQSMVYKELSGLVMRLVSPMIFTSLLHEVLHI